MRLGKRGKTVNLFSNSPHSVLLLGDHVYQYDLKKQTFNIATEQEGLDIIGTFLPITNYGNYTYLNDIKHIYRLDNRTNRLEVLYQCYKDTIINSVSLDEHGEFWIGNNYGLLHYNPDKKIQTPISTSLFSEVTSIVCDQQGKVWIGTNNMLANQRTEICAFRRIGRCHSKRVLIQTLFVKFTRQYLYGRSEGIIAHQ